MQDLIEISAEALFKVRMTLPKSVRRWSWTLFSLMILMFPTLIPLAKNAPRKSSLSSQPRSISFNKTPLSHAQLADLERMYRVRLPNGEYWYDKMSGAWGVQGGPTLGFILPGLNLGGPLRADASNGNTNVFVNGRELHVRDVMALRQITPVYAGRYWLDAYGNVGYEGGPALCNLRQLATRASGRNRGAWSYTSPYAGGSAGGDGNGFYYYIDKDSSYTSGR